MPRHKHTCIYSAHAQRIRGFQMHQVCCFSGDTYIHLRADIIPQLYRKKRVSADCKWSYISSESGRARPEGICWTLVHLKDIKHTGDLRGLTYQCPKDAIFQMGCGTSINAVRKSRKLRIGRFSDRKKRYVWKNPATQ